MIKSLPTFLLLASLLLYPLEFLHHSLYLIPQFFLLFHCIILLINNKILNLNIGTRLAYASIGLFVSLLSSVAIEVSSEAPSLLMPTKIFINGATVLLIYISGIEIPVSLLRRGVLSVSFALFFTALFIHLKNDTSPTLIATYFFFEESIKSSDLYGLASPLESIFVTKNISAMFIASLYSIYLYALKLEALKLKPTVVVFYLLSTLLFFSRQGFLAILALTFVYAWLSSPKPAKIALLVFTAFILAYLISVLFDFSSTADGATERISLWKYFFSSYKDFAFTGLGLNQLNYRLESQIGIDNFHMFFMNQIGAYGVLHFLAFTLFCISSFGETANLKNAILLISGYYFNVIFQTYGYEYGNLILFAVALSKIRLTDSKIFLPKNLLGISPGKRLVAN